MTLPETTSVYCAHITNQSILLWRKRSMSKFRTSAIVMAACSLLMVIGLFLTYVQNDLTAQNVSVIGIMAGDAGDLVPQDSKTVYTVIGVGVAVTALFGFLSLTNKKVFGVFAIIMSLLVAAFHGFLIASLGNRRNVDVGIGFWLILAGSLALLVTSIIFVSRKNRSVALPA